MRGRVVQILRCFFEVLGTRRPPALCHHGRLRDGSAVCHMKTGKGFRPLVLLVVCASCSCAVACLAFLSFLHVFLWVCPVFTAINEAPVLHPAAEGSRHFVLLGECATKCSACPNFTQANQCSRSVTSGILLSVTIPVGVWEWWCQIYWTKYGFTA